MASHKCGGKFRITSSRHGYHLDPGLISQVFDQEVGRISGSGNAYLTFRGWPWHRRETPEKSSREKKYSPRIRYPFRQLANRNEVPEEIIIGVSHPDYGKGRGAVRCDRVSIRPRSF